MPPYSSSICLRTTLAYASMLLLPSRYSLYYPLLPKAWLSCPKKKIWLIFEIRPKRRGFVYFCAYSSHILMQNCKINLSFIAIIKLVTRRAICRIKRSRYLSKARNIRRTRVKGIRGGVDSSNKEYFTTSAGDVILL
jgi:hypothetical protein